MTITPATVDELCDSVRAVAAVAIRGASSKAADANGATLRLSALRGIAGYSPDECVFSADAGTPLRDIVDVLSAHGQYLPFDPPLVAAGATIGGTVAAGISGPGRYRYGGIRDFIIGATVVDGEGRVVRSGGKVVKNAAGFLLHHALVGSGGRLGAIVTVTFKVFPAPEARTTLRVQCASIAAAMDAIAAVLAHRFDLDAIDTDARGTLWIRIAGRRATLPLRLARLAQVVTAHLGDATPIERLDDHDATRVWDEAIEFAWAPRDAELVKIPLTPALVPAVAALRRDPARIRFSSAGAVGWIAWEDELAVLSAQLAALGARGVVVRGRAAGLRIGRPSDNAFEERLRRVLDPRNRFRAAPATAH
jgi:glycolate oxidase FAD binding subunit